MVKNNTKTNEVDQTGLYWPGKQTEVIRVVLPFQVVETINESKADREKAQRDIFTKQATDFSINIKLGDLEWTKEASAIEEKAYRRNEIIWY